MQDRIKFLRDFGTFLALAALSIAIGTVSHAEVDSASHLFTTVIVKRFREERGLPPQTLATLLDVGSKSMSRWETGHRQGLPCC